MSRKDTDIMLGITLKQTRVYQEAQEEAAANLIFRLLKKHSNSRIFVKFPSGKPSVYARCRDAINRVSTQI